MYNTINSCLRSILCAIFVSGALTAATAAQDQQDPNKPIPLAEGTIQFNFFKDAQWRPIIDYYAKEAGLALQVIDPPPEGTFDYRSDREMSMTEALDLINQNLIMRDRVLIRSRDQLLLLDLTKGIPEDIIETVKPDELDKRGKYEIVKCSYDLEGLDASQIRSQIEPLVSQVHQRNIAVIPAANLMQIQETVMNLKEIRAVLDIAKNAFGPNNWQIDSIVLKHVSPDEILSRAVLVGINRETMRSEDGNLNLSIDPFSNKIFFTGTQQRLQQFRRLVATVDVPPENMGDTNIEKPYFDRYAVRGDSELIHDVLQTLLADRPDVRLDFDDKTGQIFLLGRKTEHELVLSTINQVQGSSDELAVIPLDEYDPDVMIETLQTLFRQDDSEDAPTTGPIFKADTLNNRLIVRGTPQEVAMAQKIVSELDIPYSVPDSRRTSPRILPMSGGQFDQALGYFEQMWPTLDRQNEITVELPGKRKLFFDYKQKRLYDVYGMDPDSDEEETTEQPETDANVPEAVNPPAKDDGRQGRSDFRRMTNPLWLSPLASLTAAPMILTQDQDNGSGKSSDESKQDDTQPQSDEPKSVPGAPITIQITDYAIVLVGEDMEALDDIEQMMLQQLNELAATGDLALFLLKHRNANEAKDLLEMYLGISSGGGGGGGSALGSLLGGAMSNAVGGAAGDMIGGLLGGGGSSLGAGGGIYEPEGPVSIVPDVKNYNIMVRASAADMTMIRQLVDLIDQPELGQRPQPLGETFIIALRYRDAFEIEAIIRKNLSQILRDSEQGGGQNQANQQAQMQQQMLRELLGRGGRGGRQAQAEIEPPKASLTVDDKNQTLVVTGPRFIHDQILDMVQALDVPNTRPAPYVDFIPIKGRFNAQDLANSLDTAFPGMLEFVEDVEAGSGGGTTNNNRPGGTGSSARTPAGMGGQNAENFRNMIQQLQRRGGQGGAITIPGGGNRGGGNRGGGQRGGGQRGGDRGGRGN